MANVTAEQRQKLQLLVAEAINADDGAATARAPAALAAGVDPKEVFCKNWGTVKSVLEYIRDHFPVPIPGLIKMAISALIRIGDGAHAILCGG